MPWLGQLVYTSFPEVGFKTLASAEIPPQIQQAFVEQVVYVYHQANRRILTAVGERLELPGDRVLDYISEYANTSAATIPIALAEAQADGTLAPGQRLFLGAFGAGFTWGGVVIDWGLNE